MVRLLNADTGQLAQVIGDDGVASYPAELTTGGQVTDGAGVEYNLGTGRYRFPFVAPGNYRIEVSPPVGYTFPTVLSDGQIQSLPGSPKHLLYPQPCSERG